MAAKAAHLQARQTAIRRIHLGLWGAMRFKNLPLKCMAFEAGTEAQATLFTGPPSLVCTCYGSLRLYLSLYCQLHLGMPAYKEETVPIFFSLAKDVPDENCVYTRPLLELNTLIPPAFPPFFFF